MKSYSIILERANAQVANMGLNYNIRPDNKSILISKNYLTDEELARLLDLDNRILSDMETWPVVNTCSKLISLISQLLESNNGVLNYFNNDMRNAKEHAKNQYQIFRNI